MSRQAEEHRGRPCCRALGATARQCCCAGSSARSRPPGRSDVVWRTPSDLPSLDALATALVPPARFQSLLPGHPVGFHRHRTTRLGAGRQPWHAGRAADPALRPSTAGHPSWMRRTRWTRGWDGRCSTPASPRRPPHLFCWPLAGTPGLTLHLDRMSATFWNRARHIGVGLLDEGAAASALVRPFAEQDPAIAFAETALRRVLDESQCYPYFIQLWGAALWDAATQQGGTLIDEAVVARASRAFDLEREHVLRTPARRAGAAGLAPGRGFGRRCLRRAGDARPGHAECGHRRRPGPRLDPGNRAVPRPVGHGRLCLEAARGRRPVAAGHSRA